MPSEFREEEPALSENTWNIMQGMELEDVELQMALQCAPVITGVKISNLLNIKLSGYRQIADIVKGSDIEMYTLGATKGRVNVFMYNRERLDAYLRREDVKRLMESFGYANAALSEILAVFRIRYQKYLKNRYGLLANREWFPHEMGLLLGYPPEDVEGFILHGGRDFICSGYWKVYEDASAKKKLFESFERAEEKLVGLLSGGMRMTDIMSAYSDRRTA